MMTELRNHGHDFLELVSQDGYKLFEFDLTSESTKPISCPGLRGRISDVSLSCTAEGCVPVALAGNRVVHCKSGPMTVSDSLVQFTVLGAGVSGTSTGTSILWTGIPRHLTTIVMSRWRFPKKSKVRVPQMDGLQYL